MSTKSDLKQFYSSISSKYLTLKDSSLKNQVNFQNHKEFPIHRWLKYREGYSVELVQNTIRELGIEGSILDPFLGSGTTTYASALLGKGSFGIEINPFPAFVAKVKTRKYSNNFISGFQNLLPKLLKKNKKSEKPALKILDKAFNSDVLNALLEIKTNIERIKKRKQKDLAFFIWLSILEEVSNTFKEGNGIKYRGKFGYRRPPRKGTANYDKYQEKLRNIKSNEGWESKNVHEAFRKRFQETIEDLKSIDYSNWEEPKIILGDAKKTEELLKKTTGGFPGLELTIFSPPYANCFDYFEIFKLELWMGGFVNSYDELKAYRRRGLVSNLNADLKNIGYFNDSLEFLLSNIDKEKIWDKKIIDMLRGYFRDMSASLSEFFKITRSKGYVVIVVANSSYGDVIIPTDLLLAQIGKSVGFKTAKIVEARKTNTSSQQMDRYKKKGVNTSLLRESLVFLRKE